MAIENASEESSDDNQQEVKMPKVTFSNETSTALFGFNLMSQDLQGESYKYSLNLPRFYKNQNL